MSTRLLVSECFDGKHSECGGYNGPANNPNFKCDCDCHLKRQGDEEQVKNSFDEENPSAIPAGKVPKDNSSDAAPSPVHDPFFGNVIKLPPRRETEAQLEKWKRRALAFQQGYKDKSFEVTALEIQLLDLRAYGADKVTARNNESLRVKLHATSIERNELRATVETFNNALKELLTYGVEFDDARLDYIVAHVDRNAIAEARAALALVNDESGIPK